MDFTRSCGSCLQARWVLACTPSPHSVYSPAPRTAWVALGCRAGTQGSSGQLQRRRHRGLHRCPRLCRVRAAHCPAACHRRVLSRESPPPGWSLRPHLGPSAGRTRSKWHWNLQTPETMGARERAPKVRDGCLRLAKPAAELPDLSFIQH